MYATALALGAIRAHASQYPASATIDKAVSYLQGRRGGDGSWEGAAWLTALAYLAMHDFVALEPLAGTVRAYLTASQAADGSWAGDAYVTALVLRALVASRLAPANPSLAELQGKVVDAQTRLPLGNVAVSLTDGQQTKLTATVAGTFQFSDLQPGSYTLSLELAGYSTISTQLLLNSGQSLDLGTVQMVKPQGTSTGVILGTVLDSTTRQPIAGVNVMVLSTSLAAVTQIDGAYQITGVPAGAVELRATKTGYTTVAGNGQVVAGGQFFFSPLMAMGQEADTAIQGTVIHAVTGEPLTGVQITLGGANTATAITDATGQYRIGGLNVGATTLSASLSGFSPVSASGTLTAGATLFFSPALSPIGTPGIDTTKVAGTVLDAATDEPLAGVRVTSGGQTVETGTDGRFLITKSGGISFAKFGYIGGTITYESAAASLASATDLGPIRLLRENYEGAQMPDLLVTGVDASGLQTDPQSLAAQGEVRVNLANFGNAATANDASVTVYEDTDGDGQIGDADRLLGSANLPTGTPPDGTNVHLVIPVEPFNRAFRNSRLLVTADAGQVVPEVREDNNLGVTSCMKPFPFVDDFNDGVFDGWTAIGASGNETRVIENGVLVVYPKGSFSAYWTGDRNWMDYTAEVRLRFPTGAGNDAGLQVRQTGQQIHSAYTFRIKAHHARLIYQGNSIAELPFTVETNRWYQLRVEVAGTNLRAYIDNQLLFTRNNLAIHQSAVGLQEDGGVKAEYDDLRVYGLTTPGPADLSASNLRLIDKGIAGADATVRIGNGGGIAVPAGTQVSFYSGAPESGGTLLGTLELPAALNPGAWTDLTLPLAGGLGGIQELVVIADPANTLPECDEANNRIALPVDAVSVSPSFAFGLTTDRTAYPANTPVGIRAQIGNTGGLAGVVKVGLAIETGSPAEAVATLPLAGPATIQPNGQVTLNGAWNTGQYLAGTYAVLATYYDAQGRVLHTARTQFDIIPSCIDADCGAGQIGGLIRTDKTGYQPYDLVQVSARVGNQAQNQLAPDLTAVLSLAQPDGTVFWSRSVPVGQLAVGGSKDLAYGVPLANAVPGGYQASLVVTDAQGRQTATAVSAFHVLSTMDSGSGLGGTLGADPQQVALGNSVVLSATVTNQGNADLPALPVKISIVDPAAQAVLTEWTETISLVRQQSHTLVLNWPTQGTSGAVYLAVLSAELGGKSLTLAQAGFTVTQTPIRLDLQPRIRHDTRLLVLLNCSTSSERDDDDKHDDDEHDDDHDDDGSGSTCTTRVQQLSAYLDGLGLAHYVATAQSDFANQLRCGRYNAYWLSGSAQLLDATVSAELREAVRRGATLLLDGTETQRNGALDKLAGVQFASRFYYSNYKVRLLPPLFVDQQLTAQGAALKYSLAGGASQAVFPQANNAPAIVTRAYGEGRTALIAFDLTANLQTAGWSAAWQTLLDALAPAQPEAYPGGARLPLALSVTNQGQPVTVAATALLPAGTQLDATPTGATLDAAGNPQWQFDLAENQSRTVDLTLRLPEVTGALHVPFSVSYLSGEVMTPYAEARVDIEVVAADHLGPDLVYAIKALRPSTDSQRYARDQAAKAVQQAVDWLAQGYASYALSKLLYAADQLARIASVPVAHLQLDLARLIAQVEMRLCCASASCAGGGHDGDDGHDGEERHDD